MADDRQFRELFAAEYGRLRRLGFLLTGDWGQAEELAQDALVRVWWAWPRVRRLEPLASGPLGGWAAWTWTNWCGSRSVEAWYVDPDTRPVRRLARIAADPPPCLDARYPSVLQGGHIAP